MCERCGRDIRKGEPSHRVNKKNSPSGFGGYVHEECTRPPEEVEVSSDNNPVRSPSLNEVAAKDIWAAMLADCKKDGLNTVKHDGVDGYIIHANVVDYARKLWPRTQFTKGSGKTAMNMIRQYLRGTKNVVVLDATPDRRRSRIFVSAVWQAGAAVSVFVTPRSRAQVIAAEKEREARRREAKLTPHEAGEDREPAPVEVKKEEPPMPGEDLRVVEGTGEPHPDIPFMIRYSNGLVQCNWPNCGRVLKPQGAFSHAAKHEADARDERHDDLKEENARLKSALSANFDSDSAMEMLATYVQSLRDELNAATNTITELEMEVAHLNDTREQAVAALDSEVAAKIDLIREVTQKFQDGGIKALRALSDINDILEA